MSDYTFSTAPSIKINRSKFKMPHVHKTTMNVGDLVPVYFREMVPGDTFAINEDFVSRLASSFIKVPLDNLFMDVNFFYVPYRIIWSKWVNLMGQNDVSYWTNPERVSVPEVQLYTGTDLSSYTQTLADYLGVPISQMSQGGYVSQLPFRAFAKTWNDWYRNENTQAPVQFDDITSAQVLNTSAWAPNNIFGKPPKVSKFHDLFTSSLPQPQKGDAVQIPLTGSAVLRTGPDELLTGSHTPLRFTNQNGSAVSDGMLGVESSTRNLVNTASSLGSPTFGLYPNNAYVDGADLDGSTVNDIRYAFALQRLLEADAIGGTRYTERIEYQFGIRNPDARLQRSEYIGGTRTPITFQAVAQTSQGTSESPQANLSAYSHSTGSAFAQKTATEDGCIIGIACIRQKHTYSQGIEKFWTRSKRLDFYNPVFAHIGEQPVMMREIFADAPLTLVFGYQEAWYDYRYQPDRVSGYMRPGVPESLSVWNFADYYANAPTLNSSFLDETPDFVDRTLSVPSTSAPQFLVDFYFNVVATRPIPFDSRPGLIDHTITR